MTIVTVLCVTLTWAHVVVLLKDRIHRGDWYFPDGDRLPFIGSSVPIGEGRTAQIVVIRRTSATGPTGIYRCDIATNAVHHPTDISVRDSVYVGLYLDPCQQQ